MDKQHFINYMAKRYGIEFNQAQCMTNMFADCLQELLEAGYNVHIDEIGQFKSKPLFPKGLNHNNNPALAKIAKRNLVSFSSKTNKYIS